MSNKAAYYKRMNIAINVLTVLIASLVTFVGFYGVDRVYEVLIHRILPSWDQAIFSFAFNVVTFLLLALIFIQIFLRYGDRQNEAERAIVNLSSFINYVRDKSNETRQPTGLSPVDFELIRERYEAIISSIPANTDAEYQRARLDESGSNDNSAFLFLQSIGDPEEESRMLERIIRESETVMSVLGAVRGYRNDLWIAGGIFRNLVWDRLHCYPIETPIDDVDIIYFDSDHPNISIDVKIEFDLNERMPGLLWSVKNQARMHHFSGDAAYTSLEDAVSKFPETCTAFAVRIDGNRDLEIISPHGLSDLFSLLVRPTPHFEGKESRLRERLTQKAWLKKWPKLRKLFS